jgi:hypothetical protein
MLHLVSRAIIELLYPLTWTGVFIPVLPSRLIQALEAPCPYIVGIERRYENIELPSDDYVLVDLDEDVIESTTPPISMPKQQRRKLTSLLYMAAPHHNRYGVLAGPPAYAVESFPGDAFCSENTSTFTGNPPSTSLGKFVGLASNAFGENGAAFPPRRPIFNAFLQAREQPRVSDRPSTGSTAKDRDSPPSLSPTSMNFPPMPTTPISRNDSGLALQATLREKRSGHFDSVSKRSSSFGLDRRPTLRRPSIPFLGHSSAHSVSAVSIGGGTSNYAPSTYAQSTLAASTIAPGMLMQPVHNTDTTMWVEGHCLEWHFLDVKSICSVCDERADEGIYRCSGCGIGVHGRCGQYVYLVCSAAFHPDQIRAAFVRCFASLFYTYRKFMQPATGDQKKGGMHFHFNMAAFKRSLPRENADYIAMLQETQGKNTS